MASLTTFEKLKIGDTFKLCRSRIGEDFVGYTYLKCRHVKGPLQPDTPTFKNRDYAVNLSSGFIVSVPNKERVSYETATSSI